MEASYNLSKMVLLNAIPANYFFLITPISMLLIGWVVETAYTGRVTMFANALALQTFFYPYKELPMLFVFIADIAILFGIIGLISYILDRSLSSDFYLLGRIASTLVTAIILLWGFSYTGHYCSETLCFNPPGFLFGIIPPIY